MVIWGTTPGRVASRHAGEIERAPEKTVVGWSALQVKLLDSMVFASKDFTNKEELVSLFRRLISYKDRM